MSGTAERLDTLIKKITVILDENQRLKEELGDLKKGLSSCRDENRSLEKEVEELNKRIKVLQLAKGVDLSDKDRKEVKHAIKYYIQEIDKCLASLRAE